ncbi:NADH-quinone oxidoreductase subunit L [Flavobacterium columnare]|uniref:NADH-quinone oxidoreductase subunit L n=1 Tax=Flavobacterium columnare TaxID=996 RepID=UPI0017870416|nr:NADH-quinone oxidoreductase subunit L [Flavobacterium columnare]QOG90167.1 NADH-quinone oxidoreductase subunit L [Flavobacterium columnare]QOG92823.1 NADH-quinone oxidoreductase subunit L [Flavobacterium columnare]QOG95488.1 NADH-quinone oxidoreductase subunit L [Flavobacterium columnare]QOG98148.1 NADH-quinone oxidoreductase subunit L [Flavobacterium columnare]QOH00807.1 NADH-quinone oxidoreductase subunit L [Flavobacterium columnare]
MEKNLALVLLLAPLFGFLANIFWGKKAGKGFVGLLGTLSILISFFATTYFFTLIQSTGKGVQIDLFQWISLEKFNINFSFLLDQLSVLWLLFVTGIGTLIHMYSASYMHDDENMHKFFAYLNLFVFFMIMLVMGSNLLILFIGWEGVGLCSYLLIGFWYKNQEYNDAAKKAFIMNRVGDLGLLIGIFILAFVFGSLEYSEIANGIFEKGLAVKNAGLLSVAALCLFIGATGKSAQVPLYTWLPDAMAGPTPVSALIHAATMVTAGIFMVTRLNFVFDLAPSVQQIIAIIGAATAVLAAAIGLVQNDIKKVLAYSTVSQLGLMFLALGLGAYEVAVFHVITHAFFKACLFLGSGSVIHALHGEQDMRNMGGLKKVMPITYMTMMISTLAISGIFPFAGFWSKDEILMTAFHGSKALWVVGSVSSIMTAFYMFRLMYLTFFGEFRGTEAQKKHLHESPKLITIPLMILAALAVVGGAINLPGSTWLSHYLAPLFHKAHEAHHLDGTAYMLMAIATVGALVGIYLAYSKYIAKKGVPVQDEQLQGFAKVAYHKFYVDEMYEAVIVKPIYQLSHFFRKYTEVIISEIILGFAKTAQLLANQGKLIQNGNIGVYLLAFVIGLSSILVYIFLL